MSVSWCQRDPEGWLLAVHAQPGARRSGVAGLHAGALKIRIAAPPIDGRANEELLRFLAEALGVPKSALKLERGESSRHKTVRVLRTNIDPAALLHRAD